MSCTNEGKLTRLTCYRLYKVVLGKRLQLTLSRPNTNLHLSALAVFTTACVQLVSPKTHWTSFSHVSRTLLARHSANTSMSTVRPALSFCNCGTYNFVQELSFRTSRSPEPRSKAHVS